MKGKRSRKRKVKGQEELFWKCEKEKNQRVEEQGIRVRKRNKMTVEWEESGSLL
jgi:hypothetical protein